MKTSEFLKKYNLTQQELADLCGVSIATISRSANGKRIDPKPAAKIEEAVDGKISLRELLKVKPLNNQ